MARTTAINGLSDPRPARNSYNEAERRQSNLEASLLNFDSSVEAKVRKAQKTGSTLLDFNPDAPLPLKPATTRK